MITSLEMAKLCAHYADQKKAEDILILDLRGISSVTDYFVIVSGHAEPHLKAIRNEIEFQLKERGIRAHGIDGFPSSQWLVMDYLDVLVHIFAKDRREFYSLERLWGDAPKVDWADSNP